MLALRLALLLALTAVPRLAVSVLAIALIIALRGHAHGRPPGLRHVFLHVLWIALLVPLLFVRKDVGLFIGSLVEGGRGIGLAIGWAVWLTIGLAIRLPIGLAVPLIVSLIIPGAVALPATALIAVALIAVRIVIAARCGLPVGIALTLRRVGAGARPVRGPGGAAGMRIAVEIGVLLPVVASTARLRAARLSSAGPLAWVGGIVAAGVLLAGARAAVVLAVARVAAVVLAAARRLSPRMGISGILAAGV